MLKLLLYKFLAINLGGANSAIFLALIGVAIS
jgi:hypothetical protein